MRPVNLFRSKAPIVLTVSLAIAACTSAAPSLAPASAPVTEAPVSPRPSPTAMAARPTPTPTPLVGNDQSPVSPAAYAEMPVVLEMRSDCGLCGPEGWLLALPRFRLYSDGLAIYRAEGEPSTAPYRFVRLGEDDAQELLRHALDDGGLRGAAPHYEGDADDAGSTRFVLHGWPVDEDAGP